MQHVTVTEQDVIDVSGGQAKYLPLLGGGVAVLSFRDGAYRLAQYREVSTIELGEAPGEGAGTETPPD